MKCQRCESESEGAVKNGSSRHGRQRWLCRKCGKTFGEKDHRRVESGKRASALAHYLEGVGLRATKRLTGVSHNAVINWVLEAVEGKVMSEVEWVEVDELWTYVAQKNGLLAVAGIDRATEIEWVCELAGEKMRG